MATKKKAGNKAARKGPPFGDSPILVGGGGGIGPWVELEFDHNVYLPIPGRDRDNHINPDLVPVSIIIDGSQIALPPKCKIVIEFMARASRYITVEADPPNTPLGIKFNGHHLPYNHRSKKHRKDGPQLRQVKVTKEGATTTFPLHDESQIKIHTS